MVYHYLGFLDNTNVFYVYGYTNNNKYISYYYHFQKNKNYCLWYWRNEKKSFIFSCKKKEYEFINIDELEKIENFVKENKISYVILAKLHLSEEEINTILKIRMNGVEVKSYFDYMQEETYKIDVELINNEWLLYGYGFKILHSPIQNRIKRMFDIAMAIAIGVMTLPVMLIAAIIVKLESPGQLFIAKLESENIT